MREKEQIENNQDWAITDQQMIMYLRVLKSKGLFRFLEFV